MKKNELDRLNSKIQQKSTFIESLRESISEVIVGQNDLIDKILISIISNGHILLEGVPGLAKTLTINALAGCLNAEFKRIQFTPDLLPADVIGTLIYSPQNGDFSLHFQQGRYHTRGYPESRSGAWPSCFPRQHAQQSLPFQKSLCWTFPHFLVFPRIFMQFLIMCTFAIQKHPLPLSIFVFQPKTALATTAVAVLYHQTYL